MGKLSRIVQPRTCLACKQVLETSSKGLKKHFKGCKPLKVKK